LAHLAEQTLVAEQEEADGAEIITAVLAVLVLLLFVIQTHLLQHQQPRVLQR
jgi:hypothetical protein